MHKFIFTFYCLFIYSLNVSAQGEINNHRLSVDAENKIKAYLEAESTFGISIAIYKDGVISYHNYGRQNKDNEASPTENHLYEIASITKTFTASVLAQMVNEGIVKLEDPISKYLPKEAINWDSTLRITLLELATHQSGLPRLPFDMIFKIKDKDDPYAHYTEKDLYDFLAGYSPKELVDRKIEYSNLGFGILGHILAKIENKTYEELLKDRIFDQMHLPHATISVDTSAMILQGHKHNGEETKLWYWETLGGAGAVNASSKDMILYLKEQLTDQQWSFAHQPRIESQGLAWNTTKLENSDDELIWHNGGTYGFFSFSGFIKSKNIAVVVLSNSGVSVDKLSIEIIQELLSNN